MLSKQTHCRGMNAAMGEQSGVSNWVRDTAMRGVREETSSRTSYERIQGGLREEWMRMSHNYYTMRASVGLWEWTRARCWTQMSSERRSGESR